MDTYHKHAKEWAGRGAIMEDIITNFELVGTRLLPHLSDLRRVPGQGLRADQEQAVLHERCPKCGFVFPVLAETEMSTGCSKIWSPWPVAIGRPRAHLRVMLDRLPSSIQNKRMRVAGPEAGNQRTGVGWRGLAPGRSPAAFDARRVRPMGRSGENRQREWLVICSRAPRPTRRGIRARRREPTTMTSLCSTWAASAMICPSETARGPGHRSCGVDPLITQLADGIVHQFRCLGRRELGESRPPTWKRLTWITCTDAPAGRASAQYS